MQETTGGEEGRVSSALVRGAVMVLCTCVCVFFFHKGHGLGHQGSVEADFACVWQRGRSRAAVSQRHLVGAPPSAADGGNRGAGGAPEGPGQLLGDPGRGSR